MKSNWWVVVGERADGRREILGLPSCALYKTKGNALEAKKDRHNIFAVCSYTEPHIRHHVCRATISVAGVPLPETPARFEGRICDCGYAGGTHTPKCYYNTGGVR